jgi:hypothetical protein
MVLVRAVVDYRSNQARSALLHHGLDFLLPLEVVLHVTVRCGLWWPLRHASAHPHLAAFLHASHSTSHEITTMPCAPQCPFWLLLLGITPAEVFRM